MTADGTGFCVIPPGPSSEFGGRKSLAGHRSGSSEMGRWARMALETHLSTGGWRGKNGMAADETGCPVLPLGLVMGRVSELSF